MPRRKYSESARGLVETERNYTTIRLDNTQALDLVHHVSAALAYDRGVVLYAHHGRRTGPPPTNPIWVESWVRSPDLLSANL